MQRTSSFRFTRRLLPVLLLLLACHLSATAQKAVKPGKNFRLEGVTLTSPDQAGWRVTRSDKHEVIFESSVLGNESRASTKIGPSEVASDTKKQLLNLETIKNSELENLANIKKDSLHFNFTQFSETPCLQYDGIFKNQAASPRNFEYYNFYGYLCPHPSSQGRVVQIEYANYSGTRGFSDSDIKLSKRYFDSVVFTKIKQ